MGIGEKVDPFGSPEQKIAELRKQRTDRLFVNRMDFVDALLAAYDAEVKVAALLSSQNADLQSAIERHMTSLDEANKKIETLKSELNCAERAADDADDAQHEAESELADAETSLREAENKITALEREIAEMERNNEPSS